MTKKKKLYLSNSQIDTYADCPRKWYIDKVLKIRPSYKASPLYFGGALDSAIETYLEKKDYKKAFLKAMKNFETNGKKRKLPEDILFLRIGAGDCDANLIDQSKLNDFCTDLGIDQVEAKEFLDYCKKMRKAKKQLEDTEQIIFNYCGYLTLVEKGLLLLEKLTEWIDENVAEVVSTQQKIELTNENGDKFIGYLDFIVKVNDGRKLLIDLKTSSNPKLYYPEDAAEKSRQLGIYSEDTGIREVAYLVVDKKIRVREPRARLSLIEGLITEAHLDKIFSEIEEVTMEIKEKLEIGEEAFEKNLDSCNNYSGCEYKGLCFKNCMKGLEKVK